MFPFRFFFSIIIIYFSDMLSRGPLIGIRSVAKKTFYFTGQTSYFNFFKASAEKRKVNIHV